MQDLKRKFDRDGLVVVPEFLDASEIGVALEGEWPHEPGFSYRHDSLLVRCAFDGVDDPELCDHVRPCVAYNPPLL